MKEKTCIKQSGMTVRYVCVRILLLTVFLGSLTILSFGGKAVASATDGTYDYKIELTTDNKLKVTDQNNAAISGNGIYATLPAATNAIMAKNASAKIQLGNGTDALQVTVNNHFAWGYVGVRKIPIGYGMTIPNGKDITLVGKMDVIGADLTVTARKHSLATGSGNDYRYTTCIEVGTREGDGVSTPTNPTGANVMDNTKAKVTLNCDIKLIAPQAVGPMKEGLLNDGTYQQSVVMNHGGSVTVLGGNYSTVVSKTVRDAVTSSKDDKILNKIDNLAIFQDYYLKDRANGQYVISGGQYVTDVSAFTLYSPATISGITVEARNGTAVAVTLGKESTLSDATINCTGAYRSNDLSTISVININNSIDKEVKFTGKNVKLTVDNDPTYKPVGLRSSGVTVLMECEFRTEGMPAVLQFDKSIEATDCTFISDNDGSRAAGQLNIQSTVSGITYGDWNIISNAYGAFCIASPNNDPAIHYTKFRGKTVVQNTSVSADAYGIASANVTPNIKVTLNNWWTNPVWDKVNNTVTWTTVYAPYTQKKVNLASTVAEDQPFIQRTKACANITLGDHVKIDSKAANIYCTDLAGFKINASDSYNANANNKIMTLQFDEVAAGNVAVSGTTNAQMYKLISNTHSLQVGTGANVNNLVMFAGVTLNVFSATIKDGYIFATCGFLDDRVTEYTVWIGTNVSPNQALADEKEMVWEEMELEKPDELGRFVAKFQLKVGDVGKRVIQLRYHSVDDKSAIATLLITILEKDVGILTGDINFGKLEDGDTLEYKKDNGDWEILNGNTIPNDALINSEGQIELKYTPNGGESFIFNAEAAIREPDIAANVDPLTDKISVTDNSVTVTTMEGFEYRLTDTHGNVILGCSWTGGNDGKVVFSGLSPDTEYRVEAHIKGTEITLPSKSVSAIVKTLTNEEQLLEQAKAVAKKELDNFISGIVSPELIDIVNTAQASIVSATDQDAVDALVDAAKKQCLDIYKEEAKGVIDAINADLTHSAELTEVLETVKTTLDRADSFESIDNAKAEGALKLQKEDGKARLDKYIDGVNEDQALQVIADAKSAIDHAKTNGEIGMIADKAEADAFDVYQSAKLKELIDCYNALKDSGKYNAAGLAELASVYQNNTDGALNNLQDLTQADGFIKVDEKLAEGIRRLNAVKVSSVGSGGIENGSDSGSEFEYPDDKKDDILAGKVESSEGMNSNIELQIKKDATDNKNKVENAIKNGNIKAANGNSLTTNQAVELLRDKVLKATFDVRLVYNHNGQITIVPDKDIKGSYTIKILLPQNMRNIQSLQIVYIDDNGNVEVYDTVRVGNYIEFTTTHFSSFLILGESDVNLWWLIILLSVIIVLELAFILLWHIVFKKKLAGNNKSVQDDTKTNGSQNVKANKTYSVAPVALLGLIVPNGGVIAIIILALAALGLGAYIVYMLLHTLPTKTDKGNSAKESTSATEEIVTTTIPAPVPLAIFRLSRHDVLERIEIMAADKANFPVLPFTKERSSDGNCDSFRCGEFWSFGVMFESNAELLKLMLRLDKDYAQGLKSTHSGVEATEFGGGKEWYKIIIDDTFTSKKQVFAILDEAYSYVLNTRYTFDEDKKQFVTDEAQAAKDEETLAEVVKVTEKKDDELADAEVVAEKRSILILSQLSFKPLKKEIATTSIALFGDSVKVSERGNATITGLPLADTYYSLEGVSDAGTKKKVCFLYVYQLKNNKIKIRLKISKALADSFMEEHPSLCRSEFPKGKGWYVFYVDGSFPSMDSLTRLITAARDFVNTQRPPQ